MNIEKYNRRWRVFPPSQDTGRVMPKLRIFELDLTLSFVFKRIFGRHSLNCKAYNYTIKRFCVDRRAFYSRVILFCPVSTFDFIEKNLAGIVVHFFHIITISAIWSIVEGSRRRRLHDVKSKTTTVVADFPPHAIYIFLFRFFGSIHRLTCIAETRIHCRWLNDR